MLYFTICIYKTVMSVIGPFLGYVWVVWLVHWTQLRILIGSAEITNNIPEMYQSKSKLWMW